MKIYLHIGTHKTGTTSIQHFAEDNIELLSKHGIYWPRTRELRNTSRQHSLLWRMLQAGEDVRVAEFVTRSLKRAEEEGAHSVLFSGEGFCHATEAEAAALYSASEDDKAALPVDLRVPLSIVPPCSVRILHSRLLRSCGSPPWLLSVAVTITSSSIVSFIHVIVLGESIGSITYGISLASYVIPRSFVVVNYASTRLSEVQCDSLA